MSCSLDESIAYCKSLTRRTAGNFYFAFLTLPKDLFSDMCVLYAFMRECDDLVDGGHHPPAERLRLLEQREAALRSALDHNESETPTLTALVDVVRRHSIPSGYLFALIDGIRRDLHPVAFNTFSDLEEYCYHVAGVVGLCCIHIWGFTDKRALPRAVDCGLAFQLTNILRDLSEDTANGRYYLPRCDLDCFGYTIDDLRRGCCDERFRELMQFETSRAREYYRRARELFDYLAPPGRPVMSAMLRIYGGLLDEIERCDYDVFSGRIRLPVWRKLLISVDETVRNRWLAGIDRSKRRQQACRRQ